MALLPIQSRRAAYSANAIGEQTKPANACLLPIPNRRTQSKNEVDKALAPLLPIQSRKGHLKSRGVVLDTTVVENEAMELSGGATRRSSQRASSAFLTPAALSAPKSGHSGQISTRTIRVQFSNSPATIVFITPHNSLESPWASPATARSLVGQSPGSNSSDGGWSDRLETPTPSRAITEGNVVFLSPTPSPVAATQSIPLSVAPNVVAAAPRLNASAPQLQAVPDAPLGHVHSPMTDAACGSSMVLASVGSSPQAQRQPVVPASTDSRVQLHSLQIPVMQHRNSSFNDPVVDSSCM